MSKPGRIWFPLDANFTRDPAIQAAGDRAAMLYLAILGQLKLTGGRGFVARSELPGLGIARWEPRFRDLERVGLVKSTGVDDVYSVPAWEAWQDTSYDRAAYMRTWRARRNRLTAVDDPDETAPNETQ